MRRSEKIRERESFLGDVSLHTVEYIPGRKIVESLGLVAGTVVYSKHIGRDIAASLKSLFGGEIYGYSELISEARTEASARMLSNAAARGANAVIGVRFSTSAVGPGMTEVAAFGTAVRTTVSAEGS